MHYATNFHYTSSAFLNIHPVTITYILLWLLSVLGVRDADSSDQHLLSEVPIPLCNNSMLCWQQSRQQTFLHLRGVDTSLSHLGCQDRNNLLLIGVETRSIQNNQV